VPTIDLEYVFSPVVSPAIVAEYETKLIPKETLRQKLNEFYELLASRTDDLGVDRAD
jgi:hypothetical protein